MHRAEHVFESRSRIGRIPLIAHLTPWLPKVRQHRQKNWTIFRLTAFTIPKLGAFPMLMLIVVLVHLLEIFYCKTFLLRHVQNLDFCFPVLVFLEISPSRTSVFDNATPPASSCFVNAHRVVLYSGQFYYTGLRLPVPPRLNIPVWRALLQGYEDRVICDFLEFGWPLGYTN